MAPRRAGHAWRPPRAPRAARARATAPAAGARRDRPARARPARPGRLRRRAVAPPDSGTSRTHVNGRRARHDRSVWWLVATAFAGKLVPAVLPVRCDGEAADRARAPRRGGAPRGGDGARARADPDVLHRPGRRRRRRVWPPRRQERRAELRLRPALRVARGQGGVPLPAARATPTAASTLRPAYEALRTRSDAVDDLLVAVRAEGGPSPLGRWGRSRASPSADPTARRTG